MFLPHAAHSVGVELKNFLEFVDSPNGTCEIQNRGDFLIRETVTMAPRRGFFLSQKIRKWRTSKFFLEKIYPFASSQLLT